ncbi:hypothetical protein J6590_067075 [Homalodisca vitripennis]|nr:hypothetical protein J6590_067075 [Homalodisca vitripennis]
MLLPTDCVGDILDNCGPLTDYQIACWITRFSRTVYTSGLAFVLLIGTGLDLELCRRAVTTDIDFQLAVLSHVPVQLAFVTSHNLVVNNLTAGPLNTDMASCDKRVSCLS